MPETMPAMGYLPGQSLGSHQDWVRECPKCPSRAGEVGGVCVQVADTLRVWGCCIPCRWFCHAQSHVVAVGYAVCPSVPERPSEQPPR